MEGWVDLVDLIAPRPGVEPVTFRSQVQRSTNAITKTINNNNMSGTWEDPHLLSIAIKTAGSWSQQTTELVHEIERRFSVITEDNRETIFLFQRLSVALQRGNAVWFLGTFPQVLIHHCSHLYRMLVLRLCASGQKNNRIRDVRYHNSCSCWRLFSSPDTTMVDVCDVTTCPSVFTYLRVFVSVL